MADVGTGTTIVFGTTSFAASVVSVNQTGISRPSIDTTHFGASTRTFIPGDLVDYGQSTMEFFFDPDEQPPIANVAETITITFPIPSGLTNGATASGSGFIMEWELTDPLEEAMTATATIKWAGLVTYADAS